MAKKLKYIDPLTGKAPIKRRQPYASIHTGIRGVYLHQQTGEWDVCALIDKERVYLGRFPTFQEAIKARNQEEVKHSKVQPTPPIKDKLPPPPKKPLANLVGQKYGRLTVIEEGKKHLGQRTWRCQCECGNFKDINPCSLKNGSTRSCGCLRKEFHEKRAIKDLSGQTFGRLTALREVEPRGGKRYWLCKCSCGREKEILGSSLKNEGTKSCGCLKMGLYNKNN
ncbi:hypothetical protein NSQ26_07645 [Bacillus sp. FSL W7-1360]